MKLLVDIGNTRTKHCSIKQSDSGLFSPIVIINNINFEEAYFAKHFINATMVIVANVATNLYTKKLAIWCKKNNIICIEVSSQRIKGRVRSGYEQPEQLGVDRWLTLVAAEKLFPKKNVLIIDAGTATTIDLLASSGQHLGGWILAGISTLFSSVLKETVKVKAEVVDDKNLAFGNNTNSNVNNACWAATVGLIKQGIEQAEISVSQLDEIIITGGNAKGLDTLLSQKVTLIDDLIFYGLNAYS